jgi:conjugal transfer pilus assembly protein TraL
MADLNLYRVVSHLNAPVRYLTLTLDEFCVVALSMVLLAVSNHRIAVGVLGGLLYSGLKQLKKGQGPRFLMVCAYWHLPSFITAIFLPHLPASQLRVWVP